MNATTRFGKPIVLICSCHRECPDLLDPAPRRPYVEALRRVGVIPLIMPAHAPGDEIQAMLALCDGMIFTGDPAAGDQRQPGLAGRSIAGARSRRNQALMREALEAGIPVLAIGRGFQEMNLAYGGQLRRHPGAASGEPGIEIVHGSVLYRLFGGSWSRVPTGGHGWGIERLGRGLRTVAYTDGGVIEAITRHRAPAFNLGVQWEPEWNLSESALSQAIFGGFARACRTRSAERRREEAVPAVA